MSTVTWKDLEFASVPGAINFRDRLLNVGEDHIARWQEDPDGRYSLKQSTEGSDPQLDRFFPSL
jgi:hypothetical protein